MLPKYVPKQGELTALFKDKKNPFSNEVSVTHTLYTTLTCIYFLKHQLPNRISIPQIDLHTNQIEKYINVTAPWIRITACNTRTTCWHIYSLLNSLLALVTRLSVNR